MRARKPPKRLFKSPDVVHSYQHDRENRTGMKHMTRDHLDVLQNIESVLVAAQRKVPSIDDDAVDRALRIAMRGGGREDADDLEGQVLCGILQSTRNMRDDVPDLLWRAALKTVADSVRRHSTLAPEETSYLDFVAQYVR
jgi:hypothetical protein